MWMEGLAEENGGRNPGAIACCCIRHAYHCDVRWDCRASRLVRIDVVRSRQWIVVGVLPVVFATHKQWRWPSAFVAGGGAGWPRAADMGTRTMYLVWLGPSLRGVVSEDVDTGKRGETIV